MHNQTLQLAITTLNAIPRRGTQIRWPSNIDATVLAVSTILSSPTPNKTLLSIVDACKVGRATLGQLCRGTTSDGKPWPELYDRLLKMGVQPRGPAPEGIDAPAILRAAILGAVALEPTPATVAPVVEIPKVEQPTPVVEAPKPEPMPSVKPVLLSVTQKGTVEALPRTPTFSASPMAAASGAYATVQHSAPAVITKIDPNSKDILIITTERIAFGTPAWCERMAALHVKPKT